MKTKIKNAIIAAALLITAFACENDENDFLIPKGENNEVQIENSVYTHQTYFDLSSNSVVLTVDNNDWDLTVQTSGEAGAIKLNPAKGYRVYKTSSKDITEDIELPENPDWTYDDPSGELDDLAFSDWDEDQVYVIAKKVVGLDPTAPPTITPFARISFSKQGSDVVIKWVPDGESDVSEFAMKATGESHPFTWFSFEAKGEASVQPPASGSYDIVFTTYTGEVENGPMSFDMELRGVLTNRYANVVSYRYEPEESTDEQYIEIFNNLTKQDVENDEFEDDADEIGYEWKKFNRNSMNYEIDKSNMYFIRDNSGNYYKIRFTNFYNDKGDKGYVSFTYALL